MTNKHYMIYVNEPKYVPPRWEHYKKGQYLIADSLLDVLKTVKYNLDNFDNIKDINTFNVCTQSLAEYISKIVYPLDLPSHDLDEDLKDCILENETS